MSGGRNGKDPFFVLPPKSQPIVIGGRPVHDQRIGNYPVIDQHHRLHHRASSESVLIDEQPFWLDDLLNDPDTPPAKKGTLYHNRSSSESYTYGNDDIRRDNINIVSQQRNVIPRPHPFTGRGATYHHQMSGGGRPMVPNMLRHGSSSSSSSSGDINKTQNQEVRNDHWIEDSMKNQSDSDPKRAKQ